VGLPAESEGLAAFALGLHFATNGVHGLIVDAATGEAVGAAETVYPNGVDGVILDDGDPDLARQFPDDYRWALAKCVKAALKRAARRKRFKAKRVIGIGVCATGSTPLPVDVNCQPWADETIFQDEPNAYAWLWRDRTSQAEAEQITELVAREHPEYLA